MDVTEAIRTRIEIREYTDDPVGQDTITDVLDAGRLASSGRNLQHWRFILIDDPDDLAALAANSPTGGWVSDAAFAVVVCTDPTYDFHALDAGRAITHMQLAAWAAGVGSCVYTVDQPELNTALEIPDTHELTAIVGFGYPTREIQGVKNREPLDAIAAHGTFTQPYQA